MPLSQMIVRSIQLLVQFNDNVVEEGTELYFRLSVRLNTTLWQTVDFFDWHRLTKSSVLLSNQKHEAGMQ